MFRLKWIVVVLALGAGWAEAAPLGPATLFGRLQLTGAGTVDVTEFGTFSSTSVGFGSVSLASVGQPFPSLTAEVALGPESGALGYAAVSMQYQVQVLGPPGQVVPVTVFAIGDFFGEATAQADFGARIEWALFLGPGVIGSKGDSFVGPGSLSGSLDDAVDVQLLTNVAYTVGMFASVGANTHATGARAHARAFIDPTFTFGSSVDPSVFSFAFSPGIGNTRPSDPDPDPDPDPGHTVPEPATLALLATAALSAGVRWRARL